MMPVRIVSHLLSRELVRVFLVLALAFGFVSGMTLGSTAPARVLVEENEEEGCVTEMSAAEWTAPTRGDRRRAAVWDRRILAVDTARPLPSRSSPVPTHSALADPFHNGLGSPYRC